MDQELLKIARELKRFQTSDILKKMPQSFSRQYISLRLSLLVKQGLLQQYRKGKYTYYTLPGVLKHIPSFHIKLQNKNLKEHEIWELCKRKCPLLKNLSENVESIFVYAFSEMLNNAIDHSLSKTIDISWREKGMFIVFEIRDIGIGVFRNIMKKRGLDSEIDAIQDLLKGKITTMPQAHSGEGIFFTSKIADYFSLKSYDYFLLIDHQIHDTFVGVLDTKIRGTKVVFSIHKKSKKHLNDIFKMYQSSPTELAFDKTEVQVRLYILGTIYVSRSQAKRVLSGLEKFKTVVLDFDKVPTIGQAFADEVFRVFHSQHPEISLQPINMNEAVKFMVNRAINTQR